MADNPYLQYTQPAATSDNPYLQFTQPAAPQASDDMSGMDRLLAQYGRGVAELGQGIKQGALHAGGAFGLADPQTVSDYDKQIQEEARLYDKDLGKRPGGSAVPAIAQMITTLPVGGFEAIGGKGIAAAAGNTALQGALAGAAQPVTNGGGNYAGEKAADVGLGALVGGGTNLGLRTLGGALEAANPANLASKTLNYFNAKANASPMAREGEQLAAATGVDLTPAQVSGSKAMSQAENAARQSIFSRDIAAEGDKRRTQQLMDYYQQTMDGISGSGADPATVGEQVRAATQNVIGSIEKDRASAAAQDYGKVRAMTNGAATIQPQTTATLLQQISDEYGGVGTPGADSIAKFAQKQLSNVGAGGLNATDQAAIASIGQQNLNPAMVAALDKQIPGFSQRLAQGSGGAAPAEGNLDKLIQLRSYLSKVSSGQAKISGDNIDKKIGVQLMQGIDKDLDDNAQAIGGDLGGALDAANKRYKAYSGQIDSVKASSLGKLLGEDFSGAIQSGSFNTIPPETVAQRLFAMKPSQIATVKGLLANDPDTLSTLKRGYLESALNDASAIPASDGANTPVMRPNVLVKQLDPSKLKALFDPNEMGQINNILGTARRLSDRTGYNFSGTAGQNEVLSFLNNPLGAGKKALNDVVGFGLHAGTAGLGAKAVARLMTDADGRAALMKWQSLPQGSAQARQLASYLAATYSDQPEQAQ